MTPQEGGPPLMLVGEDGSRYDVVVEGVEILKSDPQRGHMEVYRLAPLT